MDLFAYSRKHRSKKDSRKLSKLARNDEQRHGKSLLEIALKKHSSVNSLTASDPARAHVARQKVQREREAEDERLRTEAEDRRRRQRQEEEVRKEAKVRKETEDREVREGVERDLFAGSKRVGNDNVDFLDSERSGREMGRQIREQEVFVAREQKLKQAGKCAASEATDRVESSASMAAVTGTNDRLPDRQDSEIRRKAERYAEVQQKLEQPETQEEFDSIDLMLTAAMGTASVVDGHALGWR